MYACIYIHVWPQASKRKTLEKHLWQKDDPWASGFQFLLNVHRLKLRSFRKIFYKETGFCERNFSFTHFIVFELLYSNGIWTIGCTISFFLLTASKFMWVIFKTPERQHGNTIIWRLQPGVARIPFRLETIMATKN